MNKRLEESDMKVAVIVNREDLSETASIIRALRHFGIIYEVISCKTPITFLHSIRQYACVLVLGEDSLSSIDKDKTPKELVDAIIADGAGIVNFNHKNDLRSGSPLSVCGQTDSVHVVNDPHYITHLQPSDAVYSLLNSVEYSCISEKTDNVLLVAENGNPLLTFDCIGHSRYVQFLVSPKLWLKDYFGHGEGLEDIIWRAIVWAARKPFVMFSVPPFITARVDDCKGFDGFRYVDVFNESGFVPNIGLFIDEVRGNSSSRIRQLCHKKLAEFSPHAFTTTEAIYGKLNVGPASNGKIKDNFRRVDNFFCEHGIGPSKVNNPHFYEYGANAIPFLKARGQDFTMSMLLPDRTHLDVHRDWKPSPYGHYGYSFDVLPEHPDFFMVRGDHISHRLHEYQDDDTYRIKDIIKLLLLTDFLWERTSFHNPGAPTDIQAAIDCGVKNLSLGLNNLSFGVITTHEYLIEKLAINEWELIISGIKESLAKYEVIPTSYDHIAEYLLNRNGVELCSAKYEAKTRSITCDFRGNSNMPLLIYIFTEEDDKILQYFEKIEPFSGKLTQRIRVSL